MSNDSPTVDRLQPRRWRLLAALRRIDSPATIDEITDEVHARRAPSDPLAGLESWDRTHQRLHEVDLPALQLAGLIQYDEDRGVVTSPRTADPEMEGLAHPTEHVPDERDASGPATVTMAQGKDDAQDGAVADGDRWRHRYLATTVASAALVVGTATLVPEEPMATTAAAALVAGLFAVLSVAHVLTAR